MRDQIKAERQQMELQQKEQNRQLAEEAHRAKLEKYAVKGKNRAYPYGMNYSKATDADVSNTVSTTQPKYKKITSELLRKACQDKRVKEDLLIPEPVDPNKNRKGADFERLYKSNDKTDIDVILAKHDRIMTTNTDLTKDKFTPNKLNTNYQEVTNRMMSYTEDKISEMQKLRDKYKQELDKTHQQFKPCKGSEKIVKTLFNKEKEYTIPAHERLHNKNKSKTTKVFNNVIQKTEITDRKLGSVEDPKVKYTTELSNCIEINKRLGIDDLLPQKDVIKAAAVKKLEAEKKARQEFEEMIREHNKQNRNKRANKSKISSKVNKSELHNTSK